MTQVPFASLRTGDYFRISPNGRLLEKAGLSIMQSAGKVGPILPITSANELVYVGE